MKQIEAIERQMPQKRRALLHCLREHHWAVVGVDDSDAGPMLDEKWLIESMRESKGVGLTLWMFKWPGRYDAVDGVVATTPDSPQPNPYAGKGSVAFDGRRFERQLEAFMKALHAYRTTGSLLLEEPQE